MLDEVVLRIEYARIADTIVANEPSPTYWPDLVSELGLFPETDRR